MPLISLKFLLFFVAVVVFYYVVPSRVRWVILLLASYVFFSITGLKNLIYILFTTVTTFMAGRLMDRQNLQYDQESKQPGAKKKELKQLYKKRKLRILLPALLSNLLILVVLKYINDFIGYYNSFVQLIHVDVMASPVTLLVPLGLSYYTFNSLGYILDIYRGKYRAETNPFHYALFVGYFPQLTEGPISRYDALAPQFFAEHRFSFRAIKSGVYLMLWGYFKKLVIADHLSIVVGTIFDGFPEEYHGAYLLIGGVLYAFQAYTDFSGGIDIVRGFSETLGIILPENFLRPFFARELRDYWHRWHISLNDWLRDYIFYPMTLSKSFVRAGQKCRKWFGVRIGKNLAIYTATMIIRIIVAAWHGLSFNYVLNGMINGFCIIFGIQFGPELRKAADFLHINREGKAWKLFQMLRTFTIVGVARMVSRSGSARRAFAMLKSIFTTFNPGILVDGSLFKLGLEPAQCIMVFAALMVLLAASILQERGMVIRDRIFAHGFVVQMLAFYLILFAIIIFGAYGPGFDASSFIYEKI